MNKPCKRCGKIIENKHSVSLKNRIYCGKECQSASRKGTTLSAEWKLALSEGRKNSDKCKGPNLYNWRGGKETENDRYRVYNGNRRKKIKLKIDEAFTEALLKCQNNKCFYCMEKMETYKSLDHLTPIHRGGDNQNFNLVWACKVCNSTKYTRTLEEFAIIKKQLFLADRWERLYINTLLCLNTGSYLN